MLKEPFVRALFKMGEGDVYNDSRFKKAYEKLRDIYGSLGYFQWTGGTERKPDAERKVVDVTVKMEEDKQYFLGKLNFTGNDSTRDKVIRREIYMNEGDVFNTEALKMSIKRVNQLGYFKQMESAPDIQPSQEADNKVDVTFKVQEQNRNQFTFGGGVSGYEGAFLNASFSTTNFLGAGETFQIYVQTGARTKNYSLSVSEPYFIDRPITAGDRPLQAQDHLLQLRERGRLHAGEHRRDRHHGLHGRQVVARVHELHLRGDPALARPTRPTSRTRSSRARATRSRAPPTTRCCSATSASAPRAASRRAWSTTRSTTPTRRAPACATRRLVHVRGRAARRHGQLLPAELESICTTRSAARWRSECARRSRSSSSTATRWCCRSTSATSWAARRRSAATTSAASAPIDSQGRVLGGNKFGLFNAEYYFDVFGPVRALLFFDAGQAFLEGDPIDITRVPDLDRRRRCASSCPC